MAQSFSSGGTKKAVNQLTTLQQDKHTESYHKSRANQILIGAKAKKHQNFYKGSFGFCLLYNTGVHLISQFHIYSCSLFTNGVIKGMPTVLITTMEKQPR